MPIHDWTRVDPGIFHDFHHAWIEEIKRALNRGVLPADYYALTADVAPVRFHIKAERAIDAANTTSVVIRRRGKKQVIALVDIVSPDKKASERELIAFVQKANDALVAGVHLLVVDLFPPSSHDPEGVHYAIWEGRGEPFSLAEEDPIQAICYLAAEPPQAFMAPLRIGKPLTSMPLFLSVEEYVHVPLEATYQAAWEAVPEYWREVVAGR